MSRYEFLTTVLPQEGSYCTVGLTSGSPRTQFFNTIQEVGAWADTCLPNGTDAFFSVAAYKDPKLGRNAKNTKLFKALWIDLDIGKKTEFETRGEGLNALRTFVNVTGLPEPTVVSSGYGMHVYWSFEEEVDFNIWKPLAVALINRVSAENFKIKDKGLTGDAVRILRIPGTKNFKGGLQTDVSVLILSPSAPLSVFTEVLMGGNLTPLAVIELSTGSSRINDTTQALMGNTVYKFSRIMAKSAKGTGCAQLLHIYTNQEDITEPHWRSGLSIAQFCEDKETAIHKLSNQHTGYDPASTEIKARGCEGPHRCTTFTTHMPDLCSGCMHLGKVSSPLLLGKEILEATPTDNIVSAHSPDLGDVDIEIPAYPFPFFRGPKGGIYIKKSIDDAEEEDVEKALVYENDFYVVGRRTDPDAGEVLHMRLIRPHDGVSDFTAPLATITAGDKCRDMLSHHGIAANTNQMKGLLNYLISWTKQLQNTSRAELVRVQFGWNDGTDAFVIGTRELNRNSAPRYSPPSSATDTIVGIYSKTGTLSEWKNVANNYAAPGNEVRAFALFLSLGSPMFKFFALGGAILHLTNASSGVGKSTIQMVANSVWGHPTQAMLVRDDTMLSKYHRMGVVQNMILCIDELTNLPPEDISNLAFGATNGRGKNRMNASSNSERVNNTTWSLPCITSGNNSLHEVLQSLKADPEGELLRVLELEVVRNDNMTKQESDQVFSRDMVDNYGHAGEIMMQFVLDNLDECIGELYAVQLELDTAANLQQRDRYYSAMCATAIWGGRLANRLGLIDIPVEPVFKYLVSKINRSVGVVEGANVDLSNSHLGLFMSEYMQSQLIINKAPPAIEGMLSVPVETPRGALVIRREPDTQRAFIIASVLKTWCAKKQISYACMVADLRTTNVLLDISRVRMSAGTMHDSPAVNALVLDTTKMH
jgi:hypothetical protein